MARSFLIAGNWKMNLTGEEAKVLIQGIKAQLSGVPAQVEVLVCPSFTTLPAAVEAAAGSQVLVGAQNMFWQEKGAFTGEISPGMLKSLGVTHVILGHSERRHVFQESDALIQKKLQTALTQGLKPILCVGETLDERKAEQTLAVLDRQLCGALAGLKPEQISQVTLAYEPVWAIGTGLNATPQQAEEVHAHLRKRLNEILGTRGAGLRILYGGSVTDKNASELLGEKDVDGALVGGASLKAEPFCGIIRAAVTLA